MHKQKVNFYYNMSKNLNICFLMYVLKFYNSFFYRLQM